MIFAVLVCSCAVARAQLAAADQIDFNRDIRPILSTGCFTCHGPDVSRRQAELRLDQRETAFAERDGKPVLVKGNAAASELYRRITSTDPGLRMPPVDSGRTLTAEQIGMVRLWIEQGAEWQGHWSFLPMQRHPIPQVSETTWPQNAVDSFILAQLESAGLKPSPPADKRTLIRRLWLDLAGLPPGPEDVIAFLADTSPAAYEKVADRLINSPAYGERMALNWLDAARYADTHGYHEDYHRDMWPWRDWVVNSFNTNMPFDRFTIEQLAGDLLPDKTNSQIVATGFNRNHGVTASGISEEYRVEYVLDRVRTTSTVWLGLTMHCAQCHDHKYDPVSQAEFYRFFAWFNSITDKGVENRPGNVTPLVQVDSPQLATTLAALKQGRLQVQAAKQRRDAKVTSEAVTEWEEGLSVKDGVRRLPVASDLLFHYPLDSVNNGHVANTAGQTGDGMIIGHPVRTAGRFIDALMCDGTTYVDLGDTADFERTDAFSYGAWIRPKGNGAVIARVDDTNAYRGWDLLVTGEHVEAHLIHRWPDNAIHVKTKEPLKLDQWIHLFVTYDGSGHGTGLHLYFNGVLQAVDVAHSQLTDTIRTNKPLHIGRRNPSAFFSGAIDDVRIYGRSLTAVEVSTLAGTNPAGLVLGIAQRDRTGKQQRILRQYYLDNHDMEYRQLDVELHRLQDRETKIRNQSAKLTVMVMQDMKTPRSTFILKRGAYDQHGQMVRPGTPEFLPPLADVSEPNRLTLAQWLVDPDHPLTSRVAVNRMWQMLFGIGIVKTSGDFGTQGELPSHPRLLDWLATEFVRVGWDVKRMMKLIVTSAAYRQSSRVSKSEFIRHPENRMLSRGPRFRLQAELIRDNALAASGLLVRRLGGPGVKPYQPAGLWKETSNRGYEQDHGAKLYRRSLYTYWKRSVPPPNLFAIDAPTRETCIVRRQRTNTPLMALVMMNDPTFVEASRALAERACEEAIDPQSRITLMFRRATARRPEAVEAGVLFTVYQRQRDVFSRDHEAAVKLLSVGESQRNEALDPIEHAALSTVASIILNMDETITKE